MAKSAVLLSEAPSMDQDLKNQAERMLAWVYAGRMPVGQAAMLRTRLADWFVSGLTDRTIECMCRYRGLEE